MPKQKSHKASLKRVRITGRGKVKYNKAFSGHLMSHKSGDRRRRLRKHSLVKRGDIKRLARLLHRPLQSAETAEAHKRNQGG